MKKIYNMFVFLLMVLWVDIILAQESLRGAISNSIIIGINNIDNKNTGIDHSDENVDNSIHRELLLPSVPKLDLPLLESQLSSYHKNDDSSNKVNDEGQKQNWSRSRFHSASKSSKRNKAYYGRKGSNSHWRMDSRLSRKGDTGGKGGGYYRGKDGYNGRKGGNTNTDGVETNVSDNTSVGIEDLYNSNSNYNGKGGLTAPILATVVVASAFIVLILLLGVSRRRRQNQNRMKENEEFLREVAGATDTHQDANSLQYATVVSHHLDLSDSDSCGDTNEPDTIFQSQLLDFERDGIDHKVSQSLSSRQRSNVCPLSSLDELAQSYQLRDIYIYNKNINTSH